jgi:NADPH:quinone reductase-like Zn-dependent oxidoreductase
MSVKASLDGKKLSLVLDTVGGTPVGELGKSLKPGGSIVLYGLQSGQFPAMPPKEFIYSGLSLHGFWLINWIRNAPRTLMDRSPPQWSMCTRSTSSRKRSSNP